MPSTPLIINLIFGQDKVQIIQNRNVVGGFTKWRRNSNKFDGVCYISPQKIHHSPIPRAVLLLSHIMIEISFGSGGPQLWVFS